MNIGGDNNRILEGIVVNIGGDGIGGDISGFFFGILVEYWRGYHISKIGGVISEIFERI